MKKYYFAGMMALLGSILVIVWAHSSRSDHLSQDSDEAQTLASEPQAVVPLKVEALALPPQTEEIPENWIRMEMLVQNAGTDTDLWGEAWGELFHSGLTTSTARDILLRINDLETRTNAVVALGTAIHRLKHEDQGFITSFEGARIWAEELATAGINPEAILTTLAAGEIEDPSAALEWLDHLPADSATKAEGTVEAFRRFLQNDPSAAESWMASHFKRLSIPPFEVDLMLFQIVASIADGMNRPEAVHSWIEHIQSDAIYERLTAHLASLGLARIEAQPR
jgi:hypothetical protein